MAEALYPVFEVPSVSATSKSAERTLKPCPMFDFSTGDFVRDGANRVVYADGKQAYMIWVDKVIRTQKNACLSYLDIGIEAEEALSECSRAAVQTVLERTITEALLKHPATERIYDFVYKWQANELELSFYVKPRSWAAFDVSLTVVK